MTMTLEVVVEASATGAASVAWTGERVLFSRPSDNELWHFDPKSATVTLFRRFTGGVTGVAADDNVRVYGCQTLSRRIVTYENDGSTSILATHLDGRLHNFPRYATVDRGGRVWFADPRLGLRPPGPVVFPALEHSSVLRLSRGDDGAWTLTRMTFDTHHPTVVAITNDDSVLYVVDDRPDGRQELRAYPIVGGALEDASVLATFDRVDDRTPVTGMAVGPRGQVLVAGRGGVFAINGDGHLELLAELRDGATDVAFGEPGHGALYVTTGDGALLRGEAAV